MAKKIRWGVLGVAKIATVKVIPAMQKGSHCEILAIASRSPEKAEKAAAELDIPRAYGSYEALLSDPDIDAIYNPLPNHMHVAWSVNAAEAGKHVLCEKPIGMSADETKHLIGVRNKTGVKIGEAFMVRVHPQWLRARAIVRSGELGSLRMIQGFFSYNNRNRENIRNIPEYGGGALMDIGCYPINISRWIYDEEPERVSAMIERDPEFGTDRLTSAMLEFPSGQASFTASTQLAFYQKIHLFGTKGRVEVEIPFNAPPDKPTNIHVHVDTPRIETFDLCDQYTLQGDAFSRAILEGGEVPVTLEDALLNMAVIEASFRSAQSGNWERPTAFV